jgi:hypothetical protein
MVAEQGIWRIRTNQGQTEVYKDTDTEADIKMKRQEWIGHVARMDWTCGKNGLDMW